MSHENITFETSLLPLQHQATLAHQRRLVVLSGSQRWVCERAIEAINTWVIDKGDVLLWVGEGVDEGLQTEGLNVIKSKQATQWLGREIPCLVVNAWSGFDVDAFGALSGAVKAGGLLLLLTPPLEQWFEHNDPEHRRVVVYPDKAEAVSGRYLQRLAKLVSASPLLSKFDESGQVSVQSCTDSINASAVYQDEMGCKTADQLAAVMAIRKVANGHRKRPLVLTADRGRGKSAALGIAAASLIKERCRRIIVTAPSLAAVDTLFRHGAGHLHGAAVKKGSIDREQHQLLFVPPDELAACPSPCDLLLVDEAAAIPASLLQRFLQYYSRVVFSSTIHGYEGTGQGFAVRFRKNLDTLTPQWRSLHCKTPIRWSQNDPLEDFTFEALMLDAAPVTYNALQTIDCQQWTCEKLDRDQLLKNEHLLSELFGLLVLAHYKTRPFDVRQLLDGTNISVYVLRAQGHVLATAILATEGGIEDSLEAGIWQGTRRVRGHLLPQSLSNHVGIPEAVRYKGARIIRIAVHPGVQRQGLGRALMAFIRRDVQREGCDYLGSLFGATPALLDFWRQADLHLVRIGITQESSSGVHSGMVMSGLSVQGQRLFQGARQRFSEQFPFLLADSLRLLEADVVIACLSGLYPEDERGGRDALNQDILSFAQGQRLYESCIVSIKSLVLKVLSMEGVDVPDTSLLVYKVLQNHSWKNVTTRCHYSGNKEATTRLRACIQHAVDLLRVAE